MGRGVATSFRPRRYYKIPKEVLEASLDDLEQLINFFVIEFQRILFAENPVVTIAVSICVSPTTLALVVRGTNLIVVDVRVFIHFILSRQDPSPLGIESPWYLRHLSRAVDLHSKPGVYR